MSEEKLDLPVVVSVGPSSQEFSSSCHHSEVSKVEYAPCPPIARSRGCVDPTGTIWKKALACCIGPLIGCESMSVTTFYAASAMWSLMVVTGTGGTECAP